MKFATRSGIAATLALLLGACGSGGGDSASNGNGRVSVALTDAPVDEATSVVVQFSGVVFKRAGSPQEDVPNFGAPRQIDLLQYQDGKAVLLLDSIILPAGDYEWIRLLVDNEPNVRDSYLVRTTGEECELRVPSGAQSGLKLNGGFTLPAEGSVALTIDFDLRKSIHAPPGQTGQGLNCTQGYLLRPTLRLVENSNVGAIAGTVASALVPTGCLPKVYIFEGSGITPDDIEDTAVTPDVDPLVVANVSIVNGATSYSYHAAFIPPGNYTASFTCGDDDATADNTLTFTGTQNVAVVVNAVSTANFAAAAPPPPPPPGT